MFFFAINCIKHIVQPSLKEGRLECGVEIYFKFINKGGPHNKI